MSKYYNMQNHVMDIQFQVACIQAASSFLLIKVVNECRYTVIAFASCTVNSISIFIEDTVAGPKLA